MPTDDIALTAIILALSGITGLSVAVAGAMMAGVSYDAMIDKRMIVGSLLGLCMIIFGLLSAAGIAIVSATILTGFIVIL